MEKKINGLWLGFTLMLIGILFIIRYLYDFSFGSVMWFMLSLAFFILYRNKNQNWALIPFGYSLYLGIGLILKGYGIDMFLITVGMFFIVPGIVFFILFLDKKKNRYIKYSSIFLAIGLFIILNRLLPLPVIGLAFICAGFGYIFSAIFRKIEDDY